MRRAKRKRFPERDMTAKIIDIGKASAEEMRSAALAVRDGAVAALPTDTVYGLVTGAFSPDSVKRIYALKRRPADKPLPLFAPSLAQARELAQWSSRSLSLARAFWPGALTIILPPSEKGRPLTLGAPGIGLRVPAHEFLLGFLRHSGVLCQTSANLSGQGSVIREDAVLRDFSGTADYIFTGGTVGGKESSVVDMLEDEPKMLRNGAVPSELIIRACGVI